MAKIEMDRQMAHVHLSQAKYDLCTYTPYTITDLKIYHLYFNFKHL